MFYLEAFSHYSEGNFPNPGTWLDQPMKFMEGMKVIQKAYSDLTKKGK